MGFERENEGGVNVVCCGTHGSGAERKVPSPDRDKPLFPSIVVLSGAQDTNS